MDLLRPLAGLFVLAFFVPAFAAAEPRKLLVISVDGMDARYLKNADGLGLKIPTLGNYILGGPNLIGWLRRDRQGSNS